MPRSTASKLMWVGKNKALVFSVAMATLLFGLMLAANAAHATTFTVNSTGDENDLYFPGRCEPWVRRD